MHTGGKLRCDPLEKPEAMSEKFLSRSVAANLLRWPKAKHSHLADPSKLEHNPSVFSSLIPCIILSPLRMLTRLMELKHT